MRLIARYPLLCLLLAMLAMAGFAVGQGEAGPVLLAGLLAVVSWFVTEGPRGRTLPRWAGGLLVFAVGGMLVIDLFAAPAELPRVLGRFTLWVLVIKLYERRTARDHAQLLSLSLLLLLVGCMVADPNVILGLIVVTFSAMMLYASLLHQLYASHERVAVLRRSRSGERSEVMTIGSVQPTIGPGFDRHFRHLAVATGTVTFFFSIVFFLLLPRGLVAGLHSAGGFFGGAGSQTVGFSEEVRLLTGTRITSSRRPVFELRITDAAGAPWHTSETLLVRGGVLDVYQSGGWVDSAQPERSFRVEPDEPLRIGDMDEEDALELLRQEFRFERPVRRVFSLGRPAVVQVDRTRSLRVQVGTGAVRVGSSGPGMMRYTVYGKPGSVITPLERGLQTLSALRSGFADPRYDGADRVRAQMVTILNAAGLPAAPPDGDGRENWLRHAGNAVEQWFAADGFRYTLDLSDIVHRGGDPVVQFLFESRRGHCEFFASGFAALFQTVGVDARVVTGYAVRRWDSVRQVYLVDESAAHAWVELRGEGERWIVFDPTPAAAFPLLSPPEPMFADRFGRFYSMVEGAWQQHFVAFDDRAQSRLMGGFDRNGMGATARVMASIRQKMEEVNRAFRFGAAGYIWMGVVALLALAFLASGLHFLIRWRAFRRLLGPERMSLGLVRRRIVQLGFYPRMLQLLESAGLGKPVWRTPVVHAREIRIIRPDIAPVVQSLTERFYAIRFGDREPLAHDLEEIQRDLDDLRIRLAGERLKRPGS